MQQSPELEQLTRRMYAGISDADISVFENYLSRAEVGVIIGTAPDEWWENADDALSAMRAQMTNSEGSVDLIAGDVHAYEHQDVGWVADRPQLRVGDTDVECRQTSVFVRENGSWRLVQQHFSIGVPNEKVFGKDAAKLG
jgi:hypothetical protein